MKTCDVFKKKGPIKDNSFLNKTDTLYRKSLMLHLYLYSWPPPELERCPHLQERSGLWGLGKSGGYYGRQAWNICHSYLKAAMNSYYQREERRQKEEIRSHCEFLSLSSTPVWQRVRRSWNGGSEKI